MEMEDIDEVIKYTWIQFYHELPEGIILWGILIPLIGFCVVFWPVLNKDHEEEEREEEREDER